MGRLLVFLARLNAPEDKPAATPIGVRGLGIQERAAVLVDPDGKATVVGFGDAYFVDAAKAHGPMQKGKPLTFGEFDVQKVAPGGILLFEIVGWGFDHVQVVCRRRQAAIDAD